MTKVTIAKIERINRTSASGKPYVSVRITNEQGDILSGFGNKDNQNWQEGDEVEVTIEKVEKNGRTYLNFETPRADRFGNSPAEIKNILILKVLPVLIELTEAVKEMNKVIKTAKVEYPEMDDRNDAHGLDDIDLSK